MKVLVHDYGGYAFTRQLAEALASRNHWVEYVYSETTQSIQRSGSNSSRPNFIATGVKLSQTFEKYSYLQRRSCEIEHGQKLAAEIQKVQPDIVISADTPLDAQRLALQASRAVGAKFVFWLQDAIGLATRQVLRKRLPVLGDWIGEYYQQLEKRMVRASDQVILISEDFCPLMAGWGIAAEKIHVIPNWAPLNEIVPQPKQNAWAAGHGLAEPFCFLYSGILGLKHTPELFIRLAQSLRSRPDARVVVVSEGAGADWLTRKKEALGLDNLIVLPFQAVEVYPQVLGAADVLVSVLNAEAGAFSVPSKVLTYLCAGRPLLLSVPANNLAARTVLEAQAGLVSAPAEVDQWLEQAGQLYADSALRSQLGSAARVYAEKTFDIEKITDQFEAILTTMVE